MRNATGSMALLLIRLVLAIVFIAHGLQKLLVQGLEGTAAGFAQMGVPLPEVAAPLVIALEVGGGVLLALGLGTRILGLLLAVDMLVALALALVHVGSGFFSQDGGWEYVFVLAAVSVALAIAGPGRFALDSPIRARTVDRRRALRPAKA